MTRILVVDDEFLVSDMVAFMLEDEGYQVERAYHGRMALDLLGKTNYSLVITDFMMPLMTGLELARTMKSDGYQQLPVILISGAQGSIARAHPDLFAAVFDKPFRNDLLIDKVRELIGRPIDLQSERPPPMPISSQSFIRTTVILLLVGLLALLGIVGTSLWLGARTQTYFDEVVEAREARSAAADLLLSLRNMEAGQRGYLLTQNQSYLEPYRRSMESVPELYDRLVRVLIPYPEATEPMKTLGTTIESKRAEMARTIELSQAGQLDEAIELVRSNSGQALMDEAQALLVAIVNAAEERLQTGVADQRQSATALRWVSILGGVVILLVVGGSAWIVLRYTAELVQARGEVQALNSGLEERVRERTEDLNRANQEIQRFAYIVTHDLRAPLVNIMGFTAELEAGAEAVKDYLANTGEDAADARLVAAKSAALEDLPEAIEFIRSSTRRMDGLINAILKLSREGRRTLRPERLNLEVLLEDTVSAVQHQIDAAGGEIALDSRVKSIVSDRLSVEQVFGSLIDNAVKYRNPSRPLRVAITAREASGNRVAIDVADNGRGIAPGDHERVFELFRRSGSQDQPGEGIGLAYVRTVVRNLGGDITLTSELGEGTTFRISLPRDLRAFLGDKTKGIEA